MPAKRVHIETQHQPIVALFVYYLLSLQEVIAQRLITFKLLTFPKGMNLVLDHDALPSMSIPPNSLHLYLHEFVKEHHIYQPIQERGP